MYHALIYMYMYNPIRTENINSYRLRGISSSIIGGHNPVASLVFRPHRDERESQSILRQLQQVTVHDYNGILVFTIVSIISIISLEPYCDITGVEGRVLTVRTDKGDRDLLLASDELVHFQYRLNLWLHCRKRGGGGRKE